jgi:arabinose-5-phosphate isomerase
MNSVNERRALEAAKKSVEIETSGLAQLRAELDGELGVALETAIATIRAARGKVIVSGMGKSGHIGRKVAATLASTGTPAFFLHPAEASHGDLGMVSQDDVILAFSWSGETAELADLIEYSRRFAIPLIAAASKRDSALGRAADILLLLPLVEEACPNGLAPTTSTTLQLVLGDALAVALIEDRGFSAQDFRQFHPGGKLGARLHKVDDLMHGGEDNPLLPESASMSEVILAMTGKRFGCVGLTDASGALVGIITDGDLRRHWGDRMQERSPAEIMTRAPRVAKAGSLASAALEVMNRMKITVLFIVEGDKPVGILHIHDLLRAGVA